MSGRCVVIFWNVFLCCHCSLQVATVACAVSLRFLRIMSFTRVVLVLFDIIINCLNVIFHTLSRLVRCISLGSYSRRTYAALNNGASIVCHMSLLASADVLAR